MRLARDWTNHTLDYLGHPESITLSKLHFENIVNNIQTDARADLERELEEAVELVAKCKDILGEVAAYGNCECNIPSGFTCIPCEAIFFGKEVDAFLARHRKM